MASLSRPGALVHYEIWGEELGQSAPWVTLVNGHTRPLNDFRMLGKHLVGQGFRVIALDNRGAGQTQVTEPFTLATMAEDVAALWSAHGIGKTHLLGVSMGGFISLTLALSRPSQLARLALVSTAADQTKIRRDDQPWTTDLAQVHAKLAPYFTADFARRNEVLVKSMVKQIAKNVETGAFARHSDLQKDAARGFDVRERLNAVRAPTLVVHGDEDEIVPPEAGEELARGIPGAELKLLPGAGHLLLAERPKELYGLVSDWFRGA